MFLRKEPLLKFPYISKYAAKGFQRRSSFRSFFIMKLYKICKELPVGGASLWREEGGVGKKGDRKGQKGKGCNQKDYHTCLKFFYIHFSDKSVFPSLVADGVLIISQWPVTKSPVDCNHLCYQYRID